MSGSIVEDARGRWVGLLAHFGLEVRVKKSGACPMCGGVDRFTFDDKQGLGTYICRGCGSGTGFKLLSAWKGWSQSRAMGEVRKIVGGIVQMTVQPEMDDKDQKRMLNETWLESRLIVEGDAAGKYIHARTGMLTPPKTLHYHPALWNAETSGNMKAMVAKVTDYDNRPVAIHRTYLNEDGGKADLEKNKMLIGKMPEGSAIRLFPFEDEIGIAEGIETAISAYIIFGIPTWSSVSAVGMEKWKPPSVIRKVWVFGDNDKGFAGQLSAYRLANGLMRLNQYESVEVCIPKPKGADWNDILTIYGTVEAKAQVAR